MSDFFAGIDKVPFLGPDSDDPLAFRCYDPDRMVLGKRMEDQLRLAVAYWHSFAWPGVDPFGGQTFERPWFDGGMEAAQAQGRGRLRDVHDPRRAVLHLPRPRRGARRPQPRGIEPQPARDRRHLRPQDGRDRREPAVGHRQPVLAPPLHGRRRDQSRPGGLRLFRRDGEGVLDVDARARAARTTCCGAAARATRRCSTPT